MAGTGRNVPILAKHCSEIHVVEQVRSLIEDIKPYIAGIEVIRWPCKVQRYQYPTMTFGIVVGFWTMCYLPDREAYEMLAKAASATKR